MNSGSGAPAAARLLALGLAGLLGLAGAAAAATVAEHPDFTENRQRPTRWALLPVAAAITRGRVTDAEPLIKETRALEEALTRELGLAVEAHGYELDSRSLSAERLASDGELFAVADEARDRSLELLSQAARDPKGIARGRFTMGEAGLPLAAATGADGLLLVRSESLVLSKGTKTLAAIFNPLNLVGGTRTRTQVTASLVDLRDGQLLAVFVGRDVGAVLKNPEEVARQVVDSTFRELAPAGVGRAAKAKFVAAAPPREVRDVRRPADPAGSEVLAAFEEVAAELEQPLDRDAPPAALASEPEAAAEPGGEASTADPADGSPLRMLETPAAERPEPELQVVFLGDRGPCSVIVRNMAQRPLRVSLDGGEWQLMKAGGELAFAVKPGSHRVLVAGAAADRELARSVVVAGEDRSSIVELWPKGD